MTWTCLFVGIPCGFSAPRTVSLLRVTVTGPSYGISLPLCDASTVSLTHSQYCISINGFPRHSGCGVSSLCLPLYPSLFFFFKRENASLGLSSNCRVREPSLCSSCVCPWISLRDAVRGEKPESAGDAVYPRPRRRPGPSIQVSKSVNPPQTRATRLSGMRSHGDSLSSVTDVSAPGWALAVCGSRYAVLCLWEREAPVCPSLWKCKVCPPPPSYADCLCLSLSEYTVCPPPP